MAILHIFHSRSARDSYISDFIVGLLHDPHVVHIFHRSLRLTVPLNHHTWEEDTCFLDHLNFAAFNMRHLHLLFPSLWITSRTTGPDAHRTNAMCSGCCPQSKRDRESARLSHQMTGSRASGPCFRHHVGFPGFRFSIPSPAFPC